MADFFTHCTTNADHLTLIKKTIPRYPAGLEIHCLMPSLEQINCAKVNCVNALWHTIVFHVQVVMRLAIITKAEDEFLIIVNYSPMQDCIWAVVL